MCGGHDSTIPVRVVAQSVGLHVLGRPTRDRAFCFAVIYRPTGYVEGDDRRCHCLSPSDCWSAESPYRPE